MKRSFSLAPADSKGLKTQTWLLTQVAHLYKVSANNAKAERFAKGALDRFPEHDYPLSAPGNVRMHQKRYAEAVELFRKRCTAAPHAENLFDLAVALDLGAQRMALTESDVADNANQKPARRDDAYTLDADAWSLAHAQAIKEHAGMAQ